MRSVIGEGTEAIEQAHEDREAGEPTTRQTRLGERHSDRDDEHAEEEVARRVDYGAGAKDRMDDLPVGDRLEWQA